MKIRPILLLWACLSGNAFTALADELCVSSPDGRLEVNVMADGGRARYEVSYDGLQVLRPSALGLLTNLGDFSQGLSLVGTATSQVEERYKMDRVKASDIHYRANQLDVTFQTADSMLLVVTFRVSDHDVAFRYAVPRPGRGNPKRLTIYGEATSFRFPDATTTFLCPQIGPETGWEQTKPSYEEEYVADAPMASASKFGLGYTFPCLFRVPSAEGQLWALVGETGVDGSYCGSHLSDFTPDNGYTVAFPHEGENGGFGSAHAAIPLPGKTPWRTLTVGTTLAPIVETTVCYDLVKPRYAPSADYKPGRYTWSWLIWQDGSINYDDQVRFIDLAAAMGYEYCLVDNWWDEQIGRARMEDLSRYAQAQGVSLMLWYNSNGYWNDAPQGPRHCMNTAVAREREMAWLQRIGVKGIKVDFFGGDKQATMQLYEDILSDANRHGLQVVFHGCTIPRGWERMYPNYVASEAALASENVFFSEYHARQEGFQLTMHPFCRNALGAFDWGGVIMNRHLSKDNRSRHPRYTSDAFELATAFTNQTFIQCVAIQPNNLSELPGFELDFLKEIPTTWDETRFLDGYPTRTVVLARRHADRWYVAGLNGTAQPVTVELDLSDFFARGDTIEWIGDNARKKGEVVPSSYSKTQKYSARGKTKLTLQPMGGFVVRKK